MRLMALLLTAALGGRAVTAQQAAPSPPAVPAPTQPDATPAATPDLPVSLARIRDRRPPAQGRAGYADIPAGNPRAAKNRGAPVDPGLQEWAEATRRHLRLRAEPDAVSRGRQSPCTAVRRVQRRRAGGRLRRVGGRETARRQVRGQGAQERLSLLSAASRPRRSGTRHRGILRLQAERRRRYRDVRAAGGLPLTLTPAPYLSFNPD